MMPEKLRRTRVQGKCRRKETARKGKGEKARQELTGAPATARPGKPHQEQGRIGEKDAARRLTGRPLISDRKAELDKWLEEALPSTKPGLSRAPKIIGETDLIGLSLRLFYGNFCE